MVHSSTHYNANRRDIVIMAIASQLKRPLAFVEAMTSDWQAAGLTKSLVLKPVFTNTLRKMLGEVIG